MKACKSGMGLVLLACAGTVFPAAAMAQSDRLVLPAFAGFNQSNQLGIPCASPCLDIPAGTVIVQPNQFVSSNSAGLYYVVLQSDGWTGDLGATFTLSEGGNVVQTVLASGSISAQQAYAPVVISADATIPQNTFVGPATITATVTATPASGGAPFTMQSYSTLEVGGAGTRRLVLAFVGISNGNESGYPCAYPSPCTRIPDTVLVQPDQFQPLRPGGNFYSVVQANGWIGDLYGTAEVTQGGRVICTTPIGGTIGAYGSFLDGTGGPSQGGEPGPAVFTMTYTAVEGDGNTFTLTTSAPLLLTQ